MHNEPANQKSRIKTRLVGQTPLVFPAFVFVLSAFSPFQQACPYLEICSRMLTRVGYIKDKSAFPTLCQYFFIPLYLQNKELLTQGCSYGRGPALLAKISPHSVIP